MKFAVLLSLFLLLIMIGLLIKFFFHNDTRKIDLQDEDNLKKNSRVVEEMAKKIINDAKLHRKNRFMENE